MADRRVKKVLEGARSTAKDDRLKALEQEKASRGCTEFCIGKANLAKSVTVE